MLDWKFAIAMIAALLSFAPTAVDSLLLHEQAKADTAAMATYASLADATLVTQAPTVRCLVFYFDGCEPCARLHATIDKELVPNGWSAGKKASDDFEFVDVRGRDVRVDTYRRGRNWVCPTLVLIDAKGKELERHVGGMTAKQLTDWVAKHRNPQVGDHALRLFRRRCRGCCSIESNRRKSVNDERQIVDVSPYFTSPLWVLPGRGGLARGHVPSRFALL